MATGGRSHRIWLMGIGLVLIFALGLLAYGQLTNSASRSMGTTKLAVGGDTARQAFAPAAELAAQWQEDAGLTAVSTQLLAVGKGSGNDVEWGFQFFSPSTQKLALVAVSGGKARMVRSPTLSPYALPTFSLEQWPIDSDRALQTWWDHGGNSIVKQYPQVDAKMRLRVSEDLGNRPVWVVAGIVANRNTSLTIFVNAGDGSVVDLR